MCSVHCINKKKSESMFMEVAPAFSLATKHIFEYSKVGVDRVKVQKI